MALPHVHVTRVTVPVTDAPAELPLPCAREDIEALARRHERTIVNHIEGGNGLRSALAFSDPASPLSET